MRRLRSPWVWFALAAAAVFAAFGWLSWALLRLETREAEARAEAQFHESVRLALWRMDSALAPFLAQEAARPYFHYLAFYSPDRGYSRMLRPLSEGEVYVPSPLLAGEPEFCRLHFQMDEQGRFSSPRAPTGNLLDLAESEYVVSACVQQAGDLLDALSAMPALTDLTPEKARQWTAQRQSESAQALEMLNRADANSPQQQRAAMDLAQRQQVGQSLNSSPYTLANALPPRGDASIEQSDLTPVWLDSAEGEPQLLLIRTVRTGSESILQGVWIDWPALCASLLAGTQDLLPEANLAPAPEAPAEPGFRLAGIPALLRPGATGAPPPTAATGLTPTRTVLLIGWIALVAAVGSIALVLRLVTDMNTRRARFVSAVTHELRTPLTTFCLYSQMLADGMVRDEDKRTEYLTTLKRESGRLARLVENVLAYARLTDLRARVQTGELPLAETLQRLTERLEPSVAAAGMRLEVDASAAQECRMHTDGETLERILGNLLENACKYAGGEAVADKRILIQATCAGGTVEIVVRDFGPGVPADMQRRIFAAFERGRDEATAHRPGLGLGLSLARGLARECGGDLSLRRCEGAGAAFVLTLPAA